MKTEYNRWKSVSYIFGWLFALIGSGVFTYMGIVTILEEKIFASVLIFTFVAGGLFLGGEILKAWISQSGTVIIDSNRLLWAKSSQTKEVNLNDVVMVGFPRKDYKFRFYNSDGQVLLELPEGFRNASPIIEIFEKLNEAYQDGGHNSGGCAPSA